MHVTNFMTSFFCLCCFQWDFSYFLFVVLVTSETSLCLFTYSSSPSFSPLVCCSKETTVRFYICSKYYFSSLSFLLHFLQLLAGISIRALQFLFTLYVQFWDMIAVQFLDGYCVCSFKKKKAVTFLSNQHLGEMRLSGCTVSFGFMYRHSVSEGRLK